MPNGQRIVITGATGLIGRQLIEQLSRRGDHVTALVRDVERGRTQAPGAAEYIAWSSAMADGPWVSAIDGADAVINMAGTSVATRWSPEQKRRIRESRIDGTRNIIAAIAAAARKPRTLINASAVGYYGTSTSATFTERSGPGEGFLADICAAWEAEARTAEALGVRVVLLRTGVVLEPHGGVLAQVVPTFKLFAGGPLGSGRQWFPWIHIDDEIGITLWALDNEEVSGAINAVAPEAITYKQFSSALGDTLGRPSFFPVPKFILDMVLGEASMIVVEGQRVVPERTAALGYSFKHREIGEALRDLIAA